jgi:hypothetical protein
VRVVTAAVIMALLASWNVAASPGSPDSDQVHRVVMDLGVGRHVAVTLSSGETLRGVIRAVADDHFVLLGDGLPAPVDIAYGDVQWVGPVPQLVPRVSHAPRIGKTLATIAVVAYFGMFMVCSQPGRC